MKKLLLVFALISLFSCSQDDEVTAKKMAGNTAIITVKHDGQYALSVVYMNKDKWGHENPPIFEKIIKGDTTVTLNITKDQNFGYFIQTQGENAGDPLEANLTYREKNETKTFAGTGSIFWDLYEFYQQPY